jgi:IS5 family transposase
LQENGFRIGRRTIVDATLIAAPSSTKNQDQQRDPEMRQTKKGNQWYFGMKAHIGTDSQSKLIHSVVATPANVHDSQVLGDLLHGDKTQVWGDSAFAGQREVMRRHAPRAKDFTQRNAHRHRPLSEDERQRNRTKPRVRAKAEHPLLVLEQIFGFRKVRYRGIHKNANRLFVLVGW